MLDAQNYRPNAAKSVKKLLLMWLLSMGALLPLPAFAADQLALHFEGLVDPALLTGNGNIRVQSGGYKSLMRELGFAIAPRMGGPFQSLGPLGIEAGYSVSSVGLNSNADYWKNTVDAPPTSLMVHQVNFRKGLPHSTQVATSLTHVANSNLWAIGADVRLSLVDGFRKIPDLGVRLGGNVVLGNSQMELATAAAEVGLSKSFGIGGVLALQPWISYTLGYTYALAHTLTVFPNDKAIKGQNATLDPLGGGTNGNFFDGIGHRGGIGLRIVATRLQFGFEFMRSLTDGLNALTGKIGVAF